MKSPMLKNIGVDNADYYSDLQVLSSNAGYYVGTLYTEDGIEEPGSRDSGYFKLRKEAEDFLASLTEETAPGKLRTNP